MVDHCSSRPCAKRARETKRARRFGIFLEDGKMLTLRACVAKFWKAWWTIAPRKLMQSGWRDRTSPPLWNFLRSSKMLTPRACFAKFREAWWTIAPRGPMQSGGRDRTSPPLWNFFGSLKNADASRALWKISGSMVDHCPPRAYAKRGARPNEPPALEFF